MQDGRKKAATKKGGKRKTAVAPAPTGQGGGSQAATVQDGRKKAATKKGGKRKTAVAPAPTGQGGGSQAATVQDGRKKAATRKGGFAKFASLVTRLRRRTEQFQILPDTENDDDND